MSLVGWLVLGLLALVILAVMIIPFFCFDDEDPDMYWYDSYK